MHALCSVSARSIVSVHPRCSFITNHLHFAAGGGGGEGGLTSITNTPLYERAVMFLKYVGVRAPCTRLFDSTQTSAAHAVFREVKKKEKKGDGGKKESCS